MQQHVTPLVGRDGSLSADAERVRGAERWGYRPHLDGLRTIAVYLVVLFHAGVFRFVGGFIGVDLFFVLSGFLVTNVLATSIDRSGRVDLARFYARRVRRLLPAALVTVLGTSLGLLLVAAPLDRLDNVPDARAASLWFANWHFIAEANDYFAADDLASPFLHFWSLAIEEQFYIVFPLVLLAATATASWRQWAPLAVLLALAVLGVCAQLYWSLHDPTRAYYGTDARFYQLLSGAVLALVLRDVRRTWGPTARNVAAVVGCLTLIAFVLASTSALEATASSRGLLAAALAVVLILSLEIAPSSLPARFLTIGPVVYLGRISYATYLWHWPILVIAGRVVELTPLPALILSGIGGTALAALSAELVELPIRRPGWWDEVPRRVVALGVSCSLLVGLWVAPAMLRSDRRPVVVTRSAAPAGAHTPVPEIDFDSIKDAVPGTPICLGGVPRDCVLVEGDGERVLLVGDSHANMLVPALETLARARGWQLSVTTSPSCPWQRDLLTLENGIPRTERCKRSQDFTYDEVIPELDPDVIVVASYPRTLSIGARVFTNEDLGTDDEERVVDELTDRSVARWTAEGRRVVMIEPIPVAEPEFDQLACLSGAEWQEQCLMEAGGVGGDEEAYRRAARDRPLARSVDVDALVCPRLPICDPLVDGVVVRKDSNHLSQEFVRGLAPALGALLGDP